MIGVRVEKAISNALMLAKTIELLIYEQISNQIFNNRMANQLAIEMFKCSIGIACAWVEKFFRVSLSARSYVLIKQNAQLNLLGWTDASRLQM